MNSRTTRLVAENGLYMPAASAGGGGAIPAIVNVSSPGTIAAQPNTLYFVDLGVLGGNVTFTTAGSITIGKSFYVKLIDLTGVGTGGFTATIEPVVAGEHIESQMNPGTLDASSVRYIMSQLGQEVELTNNDGTNLWY